MAMADYNNTKHRQEIFNLFEQHHLLTATEIKNALPNIDTVTVYRTLKRLTDAGVVKEVKHSSKFASYELSTDHQHFICTRCGEVCAVTVDRKKIIKGLHTQAGTIEDIHLDISGIFTKCSVA
jgi:Fe2+ or Zn2+ uptake regulation protein